MANSIKIGNSDATFKVGSSDVDAIYLGSTLVYSGGTPPTPTGSTCYEVISTPITSYTSTTYDSVFAYNDVKWYMKNNLNQYEEYGIYDSANTLSSLTYYEGKLAVIGEAEYQYSGGSWSVVGSYVDSSVTYTIDDTDPSPYVGQELSTTFKIPYADVEVIGGVVFRINGFNGGRLQIILEVGELLNYSYTDSEWNEYYGEVTEDGEYFYLSLPSEVPQSIVIESINYWGSEPVRLVVVSMQATVQYEEKDMPLADVYDTVAEMEAAVCPTVGVGQYGVVGNDAYQFDGEDWNSASNYKLMEKNTDGKAYVLVCNSSTDLFREETQPSYFNNITYAEIGDCVTSIGGSAFKNCSGLTSVTIGSGVTSIGGYAFSGCTSLTSCTIGSGVTSIGNDAFSYCTSLTSIDIPDSVTSIGRSAFDSCTGLTSCTIGSGVTTIGNDAFWGCSSLTSVTVNATTPPTLGSNAFYNTNNCPILVPSQSLNAYKTATNWSSYASRIQAIPNS